MGALHLSEAEAASQQPRWRPCGGGDDAREPPEGSDAHWAPETLPPVPSPGTAVGSASPLGRSRYSSRLLPMRDGTRIAVDVCLPEEGAGGAGGAPRGYDVVLVQCRYGRGHRLRWPLNGLHGGRPVDGVYFLFKARTRVSAVLCPYCSHGELGRGGGTAR